VTTCILMTNYKWYIQLCAGCMLLLVDLLRFRLICLSY